MAEQPDELSLEKAGAFPIRLSGALGADNDRKKD